MQFRARSLKPSISEKGIKHKVNFRCKCRYKYKYKYKYIWNTNTNIYRKTHITSEKRIVADSNISEVGLPYFRFSAIVFGNIWWISVSDLNIKHCSQKGPYLETLLGSLFIFQCFCSMHAKNVNSVCMYTTWSFWVNLLMKIVSIFAGTGSVLHCWQILIFTAAYTFDFINRRVLVVANRSSIEELVLIIFGCRGSLFPQISTILFLTK